MFRRIVHSDWSKNPAGRWSAEARWTGAQWEADGPARVTRDMDALVRDLLDPARGPTLAAFDFPIGLPDALRRPVGGGGFLAALDRFGEGSLAEILHPASTPGEVGPLRPFYPAKPGAALQRHLWQGLGVDGMADLTRACERGGAGIPHGGCMLWLVGAKTVGKAAIHGWTEVVRPARASGARIWPFDGPLHDLADEGGLVLAESYPAHAAIQIGLKVRKKGSTPVLKALAPAISAWAASHAVALSDRLATAIAAGFSGQGTNCGDAFDAVVGLFAAIAVADGAHPAAPSLTEVQRRWEGWILGR